jgi:DKNYY family
MIKIRQHLKIILAILLLLIAAFVFYSSNKVKIDYADLYAKDVIIGRITAHLVVKSATLHAKDNRDWQSTEYQFYSTGSHAKLLAKVESLVPASYENGLDTHLILKDITGDGFPEASILLQDSGSNLKSYEILREVKGALVNITLQDSKSTWVDFDEASFDGGHVYLTWHASDMRGKTQYEFDNNILVPIKGIAFKLDSETENENDCVVLDTYPGDGQRVIEHKDFCYLWTDSFDKYFGTTTPDYTVEEGVAYYDGQPVLGADVATFVALDTIYAKDKNRVYSYGFPKIGYDPATFADLDPYAGYVKDKNGVYNIWLYGTNMVSGADIATAEFSEGLLRDKSHVYFATEPVPGADSATFRFLADPDGAQKYAQDKNGIYFQETLLSDAHSDTFRVLAAEFAADDTSLFYDGKRVPGSDPSTLKVLSVQFPIYLKDSKQVYTDVNEVFESSSIIKGADPDTFVLLQDKVGIATYAKDKAHVFYYGKIILGADPATFQILPSVFVDYSSLDYARDKNAVYGNGVVVPGADPANFSVPSSPHP